MVQIYPSSSELLSKSGQTHTFQAKYPWEQLTVGQSFTIDDKTTLKLKSLRSMAAKQGNQMGLKFRVVEHESCYEVGRVK